MVYSMTKNRYCERIGRQHKSNNGNLPEVLFCMHFFLSPGPTFWPHLNDKVSLLLNEYLTFWVEIPCILIMTVNLDFYHVSAARNVVASCLSFYYVFFYLIATY